MDYEVADRLLGAWGRGERAALDQLMGLVYHELHRSAAAILQGEPTAFRTRPTSLVNDLFLELNRQGRLNARGQQHFFAVAAYLMRQILVRNARAKRAAKRGAGLPAAILELDDLPGLSWNDEPELLIALSDALDQLEKIDPLKASIVDLRFFADLSVEATAESLQISPATVKRQWTLARIWLFEHLRSGHELRTLDTN